MSVVGTLTEAQHRLSSLMVMRRIPSESSSAIPSSPRREPRVITTRSPRTIAGGVISTAVGGLPTNKMKRYIYWSGFVCRVDEPGGFSRELTAAILTSAGMSSGRAFTKTTLGTNTTSTRFLRSLHCLSSVRVGM